MVSLFLFNIYSYMKYLIQYKQFESQSASKKAIRGQLPLPIHSIFQQIPKDVDYRLMEFIIENWNETYYKSPWSHSYYSDKVDWEYKPHMSYRLASHWNFRTKMGDQNILHCETTNDVGSDNEFWSIGQFDEKTKKYTILLSYPNNYSEKNKNKLLELKSKMRKEYNENHKDKMDKLKEENKRTYGFISKHISELDFYVSGEKVKLLDWGRTRIKILRDNKEEEIIKYNSLSKVHYKGYYKGKLVIEKKPKESFIINMD